MQKTCISLHFDMDDADEKKVCLFLKSKKRYMSKAVCEIILSYIEEKDQTVSSKVQADETEVIQKIIRESPTLRNLLRTESRTMADESEDEPLTEPSEEVTENESLQEEADTEDQTEEDLDSEDQEDKDEIDENAIMSGMAAFGSF